MQNNVNQTGLQHTSCYYKSPAGIIIISADQHGLCKVCFADETISYDEPLENNINTPVLQKTIAELDQYFAGIIHEFSIPLNPTGTEFQKKVWKAITKIPYGKTISYLALSIQLGQPDAIRAVANANARNPLLIFIPCHRVIGSGGELTGYAGGLTRKQFMLELEGAISPQIQIRMNF